MLSPSRYLVLMAAALSLSTQSANALSVQKFQTMKLDERSGYVIRFLEKMTYDIGQQNPELARKIKDYYVVTPTGKPVPEGLEDISVELAVLDRKASRGEIDLSKLEIEGVIVGVTTRRFPPR